MSRTTIAVALIGILLAGCGDNEPVTTQNAPPASKASSSNAAPGTSPEAEKPPAEPKDTALHDFRTRMQALVRVCLTEDDDAAMRSARALLLPDPKAWFQAAFGDEHVTGLVAEYAPWRARIPTLQAELRKNVRAGKTEILAERFDRSDDEMATTFQAIALRKMKVKTPLYSLRLVEPGEEDGWHLWSFAWVSGELRFIGRLMALTPIAADANLAARATLRKKVEKELRLGR